MTTTIDVPAASKISHMSPAPLRLEANRALLQQFHSGLVSGRAPRAFSLPSAIDKVSQMELEREIAIQSLNMIWNVFFDGTLRQTLLDQLHEMGPFPDWSCQAAGYSHPVLLFGGVSSVKGATTMKGHLPVFDLLSPVEHKPYWIFCDPGKIVDNVVLPVDSPTVLKLREALFLAVLYPSLLEKADFLVRDECPDSVHRWVISEASGGLIVRQNRENMPCSRVRVPCKYVAPPESVT